MLHLFTVSQIIKDQRIKKYNNVQLFCPFERQLRALLKSWYWDLLTSVSWNHAICNWETSYEEWNISKRTTLERCKFWWSRCHSNRAWVMSVEIIMGWVMAEWHGSLFEWVEWMLVSQAACVLVFSPRIIPMYYGMGD